MSLVQASRSASGILVAGVQRGPRLCKFNSRVEGLVSSGMRQKRDTVQSEAHGHGITIVKGDCRT